MILVDRERLLVRFAVVSLIFILVFVCVRISDACADDILPCRFFRYSFVVADRDPIKDYGG